MGAERRYGWASVNRDLHSASRGVMSESAGGASKAQQGPRSRRNECMYSAVETSEQQLDGNEGD